MRTIDFLRNKYPHFFYQGYTYAFKGRYLHISFAFSVPPDIQFQPRLVIKNVPKKSVDENLIFQLGMIELLSYWKATCSPEIIVNAGALNTDQIKWWKDLLNKGMGEFFYVNRITFTAPDFVNIIAPSSSPSAPPASPAGGTNLKLKNKTLVPLGGGKDSIVSLELLKNSTAFVLNPNKAQKQILKIAKQKNPIIVERTIDPKLLQLNKKGYLNGHTPFSAYLVFLTTLCASLFDYKYIALSNERSSNEGNVKYLGNEINHQYSKSFEFEKKFRYYSKKYLVKDVEYFSFLRPLYEIQIAKLFSNYSKYFNAFLSCNIGKGKWCNTCAKCLFVYATLAPFVDAKSIFKKDLLQEKSLTPIRAQLIGESNIKPFECVGTIEESKAAFSNGLALKKILNTWNTQHFLSKDFENILKDRVQENVLILGFGREGKDTLQFFKKHLPNTKVTIADQKFGKNYLNNIAQYDYVIKSPGIPTRLVKHPHITSQTQIFFENCSAPIIGVTGTKGKSTTASLLYDVLKQKYNVHLLGNIEKPVLGVLEKIKKDDLVIYELSSFQLEHVQQSPHVAVLLNLYPEHLDHHGSFAAYKAAKENITRFQGKSDILIYNAGNKEVKKIAQKSKARKIAFHEDKIKAVEVVGKYFHIPQTQITKAIESFKPLPHRLERVEEYKGITFYNDSLATIPEAAILAMDTLGKNVHTMILGGYDRGLQFEKLIQRLNTSKVEHLILFPTTGKKIAKSKKKHSFVHNMEDAVKLCYKLTPKGSICLLSPGASSFNLFKDYKDRGEQFKKFVKRYGSQHKT